MRHPTVREFESLIASIGEMQSRNIVIDYDIGHRVPCFFVGVCLGVLAARVVTIR